MKTAYRKWVAKKLQQLREKSKLSQKEVAQKIEVKTPTYQAYEEGRAEPSLLIVKQLCTLYKITVDNFLKDAPMAVI